MANANPLEIRVITPADAPEITLGLRCLGKDMKTNQLLEIKHLADAEIRRRQEENPSYGQRLQEIVGISNSMPGTGGQRALNAIIMDLEGNGPIGELLHTLDLVLFTKVIELLREFRVTGRRGNFNELHAEARRAIGHDWLS